MELNVRIKKISLGRTPYQLDIEMYVGAWNRSGTYTVIYSVTDIVGNHYFTDAQLDKFKEILNNIYGWGPFDLKKVKQTFEKNKTGETHAIQIKT